MPGQSPPAVRMPIVCGLLFLLFDLPIVVNVLPYQMY